MRSAACEDSNAFARWGSLGPPAVTPTSSASSGALVARSQAPPLSSNSPASLEVPCIRVPADHVQTPGAAAGVPVGTAPGAGAGPALAKSAPPSSRKHDTSRSDWLSYGERAPWSGRSRTPSLSADTDAKVSIKTTGGAADKAYVASVSSPLPPPSLPPPQPCLVPEDSRGPSSSHVGGAGGVSIGADDDADSLLARLAGKAKQAAAAALSASAAGAAGEAGAAGAGTELLPLMSLENTSTARSKTGPAAVRRATPSAGSFGESGVPADGGVGGVTVVSIRTGGGGGGRDESTAAAGGSAIGGAGAGTGAGAGVGAGARLSELCKEDKAKVARLMQDLVKLRAEKDGQKARFERLRAQNESIVKEMASLKEKFGQSMQLLRKYQNIVQEGEAAGGGAGAGASGRDGGGDSGAQMAAGAVDVVEVRALREALRAAEESCQKAKHDAAIECTRREAMAGELCRVKGEAEGLRRQRDDQRKSTENSATQVAGVTNPGRPRAADDLPIPQEASDASVVNEKTSASVGGRRTSAVRPSAATAAAGVGFAERAGAISDVAGGDIVGRNSSWPERPGGDESVKFPGGAKPEAENTVGAEGDFFCGIIDERVVSARPSEVEREGVISATALAALQEQVEELKQEVAMVGVRQLAITGLPVGPAFFDERARAFSFGDPSPAPSAASADRGNDQDSGDSGVSGTPSLPSRGGGGCGGGVKEAGKPCILHRVNAAPPSRHAAAVSSSAATTAPTGSVISGRGGGGAGRKGAQLSGGSNAGRRSAEERQPARQRATPPMRDGHALVGGRRGVVSGRTREKQRTLQTSHGSARWDDARAGEGERRGDVEEEEEEEEANEEGEGVSSDGEGVGWWARSADKLLLVAGEGRRSDRETGGDRDARWSSGATSFRRDSEKAAAGERNGESHVAGGDGRRGSDKLDTSAPETGVRRGVDRLTVRRPRTWFESSTGRDQASNGKPDMRIRASEDGGEGGRRSRPPRDEGKLGPGSNGKKGLLRAATANTAPRNTKLRVSWSSMSARSSTEDSDDTANAFRDADVRGGPRTGRAHRWPPPPPRNAWDVSSPLPFSDSSASIHEGERRSGGVVEARAINKASGNRRRGLGGGGGTPPLVATSSAAPEPSGRRETPGNGRDAVAGIMGQAGRPVVLPAAAAAWKAREGLVVSRASNNDASLAGGKRRQRRVNTEEEETREHPSRAGSVAARGGNWVGPSKSRNGSDDGGGWSGDGTAGVAVRQVGGLWEAAGGGRSSPGGGTAHKAASKGVKGMNWGGGSRGERVGETLGDSELVMSSEGADEALSILEGSVGFYDGSLLDLIDDLEEGQSTADELHSAAEAWRETSDHEQQRTIPGRLRHGRSGSGVYSGGGRRWERHDREGSCDEKREPAVSFDDAGDY